MRPVAPPVFEYDPEKTVVYPEGLVATILSSLPPEGEGDVDIPTLPPPPDFPDEAPVLEVLEERVPLQIPLTDGDVIVLDDDGDPG